MYFSILKKNITEEGEMKVKNQFTKTINKWMNWIGYDKPLTTYSDRRSYATILKRPGVPLSFISEALEHKFLLSTGA